MSEDYLIGKELDEYRLDALLGHGGMARVYRALDTRLKRWVAVKVIATPFRTDSEHMERFEREAQAIAQLEHSHVVSVYRYGQVDDMLYIAMQYVEGLPLDALLRQYHQDDDFVPPEDILKITQDVCKALDYVHSKGIVHRDIKPANIILNEDGEAILVDFGLALLETAGTRGEIFGTPHYVAPEQAMSSAGAIPQSDFYAVGVILYEMFTGVVPFDGDSAMAVAMQHMSEEPEPPHEIRADISSAVEKVILQALAKEPEDRFENGAAFVAALETALTADALDTATPPALPQTSVLNRVSAGMAERPMPPLPAGVSLPEARDTPETSPTSETSPDAETDSAPTSVEDPTETEAPEEAKQTDQAPADTSSETASIKPPPPPPPQSQTEPQSQSLAEVEAEAESEPEAEPATASQTAPASGSLAEIEAETPSQTVSQPAEPTPAETPPAPPAEPQSQSLNNRVVQIMGVAIIILGISVIALMWSIFGPGSENGTPPSNNTDGQVTPTIETVVAVVEASPLPTETDIPVPTDTPIPAPTATESPVPTETSTETPTEVATEIATEIATEVPTEISSEEATVTPEASLAETSAVTTNTELSATPSIDPSPTAVPSPTATEVQPLADSQTNFNGSQGAPWTYLWSRDRESFDWVEMSFDGSCWRIPGNQGVTEDSVRICQNTAHPGLTGDIAWRWTSPSDESVWVQVSAFKTDSGGDGVDVVLYRNTEELKRWQLGGNDTFGFSEGQSVSVSQGDYIFVVLKVRGDSTFDETGVRVQIYP